MARGPSAARHRPRAPVGGRGARGPGADLDPPGAGPAAADADAHRRGGRRVPGGAGAVVAQPGRGVAGGPGGRSVGSAGRRPLHDDPGAGAVGGRAGGPPRCAGRRDLRERRPARSRGPATGCSPRCCCGRSTRRSCTPRRSATRWRPSPTARWPSLRSRRTSPTGAPRPRAPGVRRRLLFFGKVRRYKGLDVLLRALAPLDGVHLTVAGEVYPDATDLVGLVDRLGLRDRVDLHPGTCRPSAFPTCSPPSTRSCSPTAARPPPSTSRWPTGTACPSSRPGSATSRT